MSIQVERDATRYTARRGGVVLWSIELPIERAGNPFSEELHWPAAKVVAIGAGRFVHFVDEATGALLQTLELADHRDYFGHFGELAEDPEILYVLGWSHVFAFVPSLEIRWRSDEIAVDGIVWSERTGERIHLGCEMDPPGGWEDVSLDRATGREVARGDGN